MPIYVISDTHGEDIVCPDDCTLIHLGDFTGGKITGGKIKVLVRGNNDSSYYPQFDFIVDGILRNEVYFSHEPQERLPRGAGLNLCGHMHSEPLDDYGYKLKRFHRVLPANELMRLEEALCPQQS